MNAGKTHRNCGLLLKYLSHSRYQIPYPAHWSSALLSCEIAGSLRKAIDNNKYTFGVFIGFSKEFDTVNHQILLVKFIWNKRDSLKMVYKLP